MAMVDANSQEEVEEVEVSIEVAAVMVEATTTTIEEAAAAAVVATAAAATIQPATITNPARKTSSTGPLATSTETKTPTSTNIESCANPIKVIKKKDF